MTTTESTVRPFSCGTQYMDWQNSNCGRCTKAVDPDAGGNYPPTLPCEIEQALLEALCGDGRIPLAIADRMGHHKGRYIWPCLEHDPPFVNVGADGEAIPGVEKPK